MEIIPFKSERGCLSYLLVDEVTREAALIDPSIEVAEEEYLSTIKDNGLTLRYVIETHTHADHISSTPQIQAATEAKLIRHVLAPSPKKDIPVSGGEVFELGETSLEIIATPGHTNESISVYADGAVFTGDALLIGGTGRTDFQLGNSKDLYASLHDELTQLPDDTEVYPSHDYKGRVASSIEVERDTNPRLALSREDFITTMDAHHPELPELFEESIEANSK